MGINVNSLSPTEAKSYWYDYNNGNTKGISEAEYQSILTKFRSYVDNWENDVDENGYTVGESPQERLDFDSDDAGFFGDGKGGQGIANTAVAAGGGLVATGVIPAAEVTVSGATGLDKGLSSAATTGNKVSVSLIAAAAMQLAMAIVTKNNSPNKDAVEACLKAQDELYTEQANLADQVLTMEEMQEQMELLQEQALETNEAGQSDIVDMEGLYNYYYTKYQNGTATDREIALMKALGAQMQSTQSATNDETLALNEEIVKVGDGYEDITANIDTTNQFTEYVADIDEATKRAAITQGAILTLSAASAAVTMIKCYARASALAGSIFGSWAAVAYIAAAVMAGSAAAMYGTEAAKQFTDYRSTAEDTIDLRQNTQDLSTETTEYQEVSTEFWEETVEVTNEENLYTLTPTYATGGAAAAGTSGTTDETTPGAGDKTDDTATTKAGVGSGTATGTGGVNTGNQTAATPAAGERQTTGVNPFAPAEDNAEDDKDKFGK